jgi:hypothetical protein
MAVAPEQALAVLLPAGELPLHVTGGYVTAVLLLKRRSGFRSKTTAWIQKCLTFSVGTSTMTKSPRCNMAAIVFQF